MVCQRVMQMIEPIAGVECYVGTPPGDYQKDKVVLFLPDAFGLQLVNNKLLVDDFARNGFRTVMPDYFEGDPIPEDALAGPKPFDWHPWLAKHAVDAIWQDIVDKVVGALRAEGVTWIAATGYCFGAMPAWHLALRNASTVTAVAHPSRIRAPDDLEAYKAKSSAPLLINACEVDVAFPKAAQKIAEDLLGGGKFAPGFELTYWEGCEHGFAVRGDMENPKVKAGKEGAFEATVKFFHKYKDL